MKNKKIGNLEATIIIILLCCFFIYEFGYCNLVAITNGTYNFSLFRIVIYLVFIVLYKLYSKSFISEAEKTLKNKKAIIIIYLILFLILFIYEIISFSHPYVIILTLLIALNGLLFILCVTKNFIKNIILTIITLGFICSITTTVYHLIDEKKHFLSALNVADGNFNYINSPITDRIFDDIEFYDLTPNFAMKYFGIKYKENKFKIQDDYDVYSVPASNFPLLYIPSSIGINIARLFRGSVADIFIAGRMANAIFYGILLIIIFKLLKYKKDVFYCIYLMPMSIILSATYTADTITIGIIGIFIAYVLKIKDYETITFKQFLILLGLFILCLLCKGGAYFAVFTLIFMLPIIKSTKKDKKILIIAITIILASLLLGLYKCSSMITSEAGDTRVKNTNAMQQAEGLFNNPTRIFKVYKNYLCKSLLNINWYVGLNLRVFCGRYNKQIMYLLIAIIIYKSLTDNSYTFKAKDKTIMIITFFLVYFITSFVLYLAYTPVGALSINGYQARYLIPVLPLFLMNINSKKIAKYLKPSYIDSSFAMGILTILDLVSKVVGFI